jgi:hypothetical protein
VLVIVKTKQQYKICPGFIIVFIGILLLQGAHFVSDKRSSCKLWQCSLYGMSIPYVWNSMRRDAIKFMHQNIHFADYAI